MLKKVVMLLVMLPIVWGTCVEPDGSPITSDIEFCSGSYASDGFEIRASEITVICDGTILLGNDNSRGLTINGQNNVNVQGCIFTNYSLGGLVQASSNISLKGNEFRLSRNSGIGVADCLGCNFEDNVIIDNGNNGLILIRSDNSKINRNKISENQWNGIIINSSNQCTVMDNTIVKNDVSGIQISGSNENLISGNTISDNGLTIYNIMLIDTLGNQIFNNIIKNGGISGGADDHFCVDELANTYIRPMDKPSSDQCFETQTVLEIDPNETINIPVDEEPIVIENKTPFQPSRIVHESLLSENNVKDALRKYYVDMSEEEITDVSLRVIALTSESNIEKTSLVYENHTEFAIKITLDEPIKNLTVLEYVPKSTFENTDDLIDYTNGMLIVEKDPLMAWNFKGEDAIEISYDVNRATKNSTITLLLEELEEKKVPIEKWLPILSIIPIISLIIIYFHRFQN